MPLYQASAEGELIRRRQPRFHFHDKVCSEAGWVRWRTISAVIREWETLHAELAEIDENIFRLSF